MNLLLKNFAEITRNIVLRFFLTLSKLRSIFRSLFIHESLAPPPPDNYAYEEYKKEQIKNSYENFKKYFPSAIFLSSRDIKNHALKKALENDIDQQCLYLEFGVWYGRSINRLSKLLKTNIYGFDSFDGLKEDWKGNHHTKGMFKLEKLPIVYSNVVLVKGWFEDTLEDFLKEKKKKINFIHLDSDTYESTHFVLKTIKPYLINNAIITFDDHFNNESWEVCEWKALNQIFSKDEFKYISFSRNGTEATIQIILNKRT